MNWIQEVSEFCQYYNISLEYLAEILRDPKVIPMIRGKAFEFFVAKSLKEVLPSQDWEVENKSSGSFIWKPSIRGEIFLRNLQYLYGVSNDLKDFGFSRMYVARACDIVIKDINEITCTRKKCENKQNCGFIPNYPVIGIPNECKYPVKYWTPVEESIKVFESLL